MGEKALYSVLFIGKKQDELAVVKDKIDSSMDVKIVDVHSVREALKMLEFECVDLIIMDIQNQGQITYENVTSILEKIISTDISLIILSDTIPDEDFANKWFKSGNIDFLKKPVIEIQLINRIHMILKMLEKQRYILKNEVNSANKIKKSFLSNMSHELRTPMHGINGMIQLLGMTKLDEDQTEYLSIMKESSGRMMKLIDNIINLVKLESEKHITQNSKIVIENLMEEIVENFQHEAYKKRINLSCKIDKEIPCFLYGEEERLKILLSHVIENAIKFTEQGSVEFVAKVDPAYVCGEKKMNIIFSIIDTGIGINNEKLKWLFNEFTQEDDSLTKKYQGAGLGLALCKKIAEVLNATISLHSKQNIGTAFHINVPFNIEQIKKSAVEFKNMDLLSELDDEKSRLLSDLLCEQLVN